MTALVVKDLKHAPKIICIVLDTEILLALDLIEKYKKKVSDCREVIFKSEVKTFINS